MISLKNTLKAITTACAKIKDITIGSDYIIIGDVGICWCNGQLKGTNTITFPIAYSSVPNLQVTNFQSTNRGYVIYVLIENLTKTGVKLTPAYTYATSGATGAGEAYWWMAIGKV